MARSTYLNISTSRHPSKTREYADRVINGKQVDLLLARGRIKGLLTEQALLEFIEFECGFDVVSLEYVTNIQLDTIIRKLNSIATD